MTDPRTGILLRIRRALFGRRRGATVTSALVEASRVRPAGSVMPAPGPFDQPPSEPVVLDPEALPWELRSDDQNR